MTWSKATFVVMGRVLALDYGVKRCGLAISDPLGMIANGLDTVDGNSLVKTLIALNQDPGFDVLVIGQANRFAGEASAVETEIQRFLKHLAQALPNVEVVRFDESFTSKLAVDTMVRAGAKRKQRQQKGLVDKISATLILQDYLNSK